MTSQPVEPALLAPWMSRQRWFANKGATPELAEIGSFELGSGTPGARIITHFLLDHTVGKPALYQVPLVYRTEPLPQSPALVGVLDGVYVYDGAHDPAYTSALLSLIADGIEVAGEQVWVKGRHTAGSVGSGMTARVLTGEQSNTSIIFEGEGSVPIICKVFRAIHHGDNPDVVLQTALAEAGSDAVPPPIGHIIAEWDDRGETSGRAHGHLAFAQQFLPGVQDAWRVALEAAAGGVDFTSEARDLGIATAGVHATLAIAMPTSSTTSDDIASVIEGMHGRLAAAIDEVPALSRFGPPLREVFAAAAAVTWPAQQRIHGDYHLGQVLSVPGRGWVLVDFEGEPLRPMRERSRLDSPMRDVAGMLRSFDYVAGSLAMSGADAGGVQAAERWAADAREAFIDGYSAASSRDIRQDLALLDAFEIDKALYETVYEARNRPGWVQIPVAAIERLARRGRSA